MFSRTIRISGISLHVLLLGNWLCLCRAVTLRGSERNDIASVPCNLSPSEIFAVPSLDQKATKLVRSGYTYNSSQLSILIPETRPLVTLPVVVLQAHMHFPELRIQIMYGSANKDYVHVQKILVELQQKGAVFLTPMPGEAYNASQLPKRERLPAYSKALFSTEFWQLITTPKVLLVQADSWICNGAHEHLKDFLQYDYMSGITKAFHPNGMAEDAHFCKHLQSEKLASEDVAIQFARDTIWSEELSGPSGPRLPSVGVHHLPELTAENIQKFFEDQCPGVSFVIPRVEALDNSEGTLADILVQRWKQEDLPQSLALRQDRGSRLGCHLCKDLPVRLCKDAAVRLYARTCVLCWQGQRIRSWSLVIVICSPAVKVYQTSAGPWFLAFGVHVRVRVFWL
ncbi:unnamed protein product [Symbiodinium sp. CCMP2592]|nr:unnamed protein product [Symbiodinium sp. CCMP2592]